MASNPESNPLDFTGRCVIVTGGTKGLGRVIAERFGDAGADVLICARNPPAVPVTHAGGTATFVPCDVRDPEQVGEVIDTALKHHGRLDVLVNNAGGAPTAESATASPRFTEKIVGLNLLGPLSFCQAAYEPLKAQGGVIVNISSISGSRPNPLGLAYGAAKAGLDNATQTLGLEWGPDIRVVGLSVGMILTDEGRAFYGDDEEAIAEVGAVLGGRRLGDPAEIASVCLFAASPLASFVSGTSIDVQGGGEGPAYLLASTGDVKGAPIKR